MRILWDPSFVSVAKVLLGNIVNWVGIVEGSFICQCGQGFTGQYCELGMYASLILLLMAKIRQLMNRVYLITQRGY